MTKALRRYMFTVVGSGRFPKDMLSYDNAVALTPADQAIIDADDYNILWNAETKHLRINSVRLVTESRFAPTRKRWESFNWKVTDGPRPVTINPN